MELVVAIYNISSPARLSEMVRTAIGFGVRNIFLVRVFGSAAQQLGDVFKLALREGRGIAVLSDIPDLLEVVKPDTALFLGKPGDGEPLNAGQVGNRTLLVVNGSDLPFTRREVGDRGRLVYAIDRDVGPVAHLGIALMKLMGLCP